LRAYRTGNGGNHGRQNDDMRCQTLAQVAQYERERTIGVSRETIHMAAKPAGGERKADPKMFRLIERRMTLCSSPARLRKNPAVLITAEA
jgi:hypothetical protein